VLAVMSEQRLPGRLAQVPTAREAGYDLVWPIIRGFYVGPQVSDADFRAWTEVFTRMLASKSFDRLRSEHGLYDFAMTGPEFGAYVKRTVGSYRKVAQEFGLKVAS
jgi:putative tricarboxylic transport membrane protein